MPHLTLEYTSNIPIRLDSNKFFAGLHNRLKEFDTLAIEKIKSRAVCYAEYCIGTGDARNAFIYLEFAMFEGRPEELRKEISRTTLEYLRQEFGGVIKDLNCSITVEVREICRATFSSASGI